MFWCGTVQNKCTQADDRYGVLGDDIVIADQRVAEVYKAALGKLGVDISYLTLYPIVAVRNLPSAFEAGKTSFSGRVKYTERAICLHWLSERR